MLAGSGVTLVINKTNDPLLCSAVCRFQSAFSNVTSHLIPTTILLGRLMDEVTETWDVKSYPKLLTNKWQRGRSRGGSGSSAVSLW